MINITKATFQYIHFLLFSCIYPGSEYLKSLIKPSSLSRIIFELKPDIRMEFLSDNKLSSRDIQISDNSHHLNARGRRIYGQFIYNFIMSDAELVQIFNN